MLTIAPHQIRSYKAGEAGAAFRAVTVVGAADKSVVVNKTANQYTVGLLLSTGMQSGEAADVVTTGTGYGEAGAAITKGTPLMVDNQGRVIARTGNNHILGYALTAASAAGDIVEVDLS